MPLIDQRILIVAPPEIVWSNLTNPILMTKWRKGCKQLSVLSTRPTGVGARRRTVDERGHGLVEETTAWIENIGTEYVQIDGPYQSLRGRFRLQAIPEGTMVTWTTEYRLRGPLAGLRNLLRFRRRMGNQMAESLRQLRRLVEASGVPLDREKHARAAMQDAPSVEARAARTPEDMRAGDVGQTVVARAMRPVVVDDDELAEAPIPAGATVVSPIVNRAGAPDMPGPGSTSEMTQASQQVTPASGAAPVPVPPQAVADTKPRAPKALRDSITAQMAEEGRRELAQAIDSLAEELPTQLDLAADLADLRAHTANTVPISLVAPPLEPEPETQPLEVLPKPAPAKKTEPQPPGPSFWNEDRLGTTQPHTVDSWAAEPNAPPTDELDTGEISIWQVFGVQAPSEQTKTDLQAIIASLQPEETAPGTPLRGVRHKWEIQKLVRSPHRPPPRARARPPGHVRWRGGQ